MKIGLLVLVFHLEGCSSLKEKRRRMSGLRERFGKTANIAVCESNYQDVHQSAEWSFVAISTDIKIVDRLLDSIECTIDNHVDALLVDVKKELL